MSNTADSPRIFSIPVRSITMSERRIMASKFGVNWDAVEVDLADIPRPEDPENPTDAEKLAAAKAFTRIVGPNERFALLYIAVKRELPQATEREMEAKADAGEWVLSLSGGGEAEEDGAAPLPPPTPTSATTSSDSSL